VLVPRPCAAQQQKDPESHPTFQSKPKPAPAKQEAAKKPPTLGFNHIKGVPPILDSDALAEEERLEKELPGNQFIHDTRAMHEAALMNEFLEGFKNSKECNGITFYLKTGKKPDFTVQITVFQNNRTLTIGPANNEILRRRSARSGSNANLGSPDAQHLRQIQYC
jgi:hypothetical protein